MNHKKIVGIITVVLAFIMLWFIIVGIDYRRVCHSFEKPLFAVAAVTADDGGSGIYKGLGYSFDIKGNFMPEDEFPGVVKAKLYWFGNMVKESLRD